MLNENKDNKIYQIKKTRTLTFLGIHCIPISIYTIMTAVFTYPLFFSLSERIAGGSGDNWLFLWYFWWFDHAMFNLGISPFTTDYLYYPMGVNFVQDSLFLSLVSTFITAFTNQIFAYNAIVILSFVFTAYATFLLARYVTHSYLGSIVAGVIFSFNIFHYAHSAGHLGISMMGWIPLYILYLIKTVKEPSKKNPVLAGLFLFLGTISVFYYFLIPFFFTIVFLLLLFVTKSKIEKYFFKRALLLILTFTILTMPIIPYVFSIIDSNQNLGQRPFQEFVTGSVDFVSYFMPITNNPIHGFLHKINPNYGLSEPVAFLGYGALFLSFVGFFLWKKQEKSYLFLIWPISAFVFFILSLGPQLQIFGYNTSLPLPGYFASDIPFWSVFRSIGRFSILVTLSVSILSAFAIQSLIERKSNIKKILIVSGIGLFVFLEFLLIPYPTYGTEIPSIYNEIKNEKGDFLLLETPIGGSGEIGLQSDPIFDYYQTIHEKKIYGGFSGFTPLATQRSVQNYFFNEFVIESNPYDILPTQDLSKVGLSILDYYNIKYVIIHKQTSWKWLQDLITTKTVPEIKELADQIFHKSSYYEDANVIVYKAEKPTSNIPFIVLDYQWSIPFWSDLGIARSIGEKASLIIVNPNQEIMESTLMINLKSFNTSRSISIEHSEAVIFEQKIPLSHTNLEIPVNLMLGKNEIILKSLDGYDLEKPLSDWETKRKISFEIHEISLK